MGIILTSQATRLPLWGRAPFLVFYGGCCEPLPRCAPTVALPARACQRSAASNRITAPHAVPIDAPVQLSARLLATPTPRGKNGCKRGFQSHPRASEAMTLSLIWWGLLPLLLLVAVVDLLTMSQPRRVQLLRRSGMTQAAIADRLGISRYRVRQALA